MRKIAVITGSRADQSPLSSVIDLLGAVHIQTSGLFGHEAPLKAKMEELKPDIAVVLGDRFETLITASVATLLCIPIAHIQGGEETEGAIDNAMRHAITKLAYWHFPIHEKYAKRIVQMGEDKSRVFVAGAPGIDNLAHTPMTRAEIETTLGIKLRKKFALVCFHPETLGSQIEMPLEMMAKYQLIVCGSNADPGGAAMTLMLEQFTGMHGDAYFSDSYGARLWTNLMREADVLIGNSSSFIYEGMTLGKKVVNIGDRQKGRYEDAVSFFAKQHYPFGRPGTISKKIADVLLSVEIPLKPRKVFHDFN